MSTILCVDEEPAASVVLESTLTEIGHRAVLVPSIDAALRALDAESIDLIISECQTRDRSALDLLEHLRRASESIPVILTTGFGSIEHAVAMMRHGAADYLTKPLRSEAVRLAVRNVMEIQRLRREKLEILGEIHALRGPGAIVGCSPAIRQLRDEIATIAPAACTVLIEGESGTGKELVARAIHEQSPRRDRPLVTLNCAAMPEGLVESSLFGHERGAYTGASARAPGAFERADQGTLLLDEISEMRLDLQAKLLRVIELREFERLGGQESIRVDVRVIATTNRDLAAEAEAGRFRLDLYHRLSVLPVRTPPLREHPEDIPLLVAHLIGHHAAQLGIKPPEVAPEALDLLTRRAWPGNVRELSNAVQRALILSHETRLGPEAFGRRSDDRRAPPPRPDGPAPVAGAAAPVPSADEAVFNLKVLERLMIDRALAATHGHREKAASLLGISVRTLRSKLNRPDDRDD